MINKFLSILTRLVQYLITLLIPPLLVLISARLAMTERWLEYEYNRDGFPEDVYGWDQDVRREYGPYGIRYLIENRDISYLADLEINGDPAFNERELSHMEDVQGVTYAAFQVMTIGLILFAGLSLLLIPWYQTRTHLALAIRNGGFLTLGLAVLLLIMAFVNWDFFFDAFHAAFFETGTWKFYTSDTLIRLYPERFWFDSALLVGGLTIGGAILCLLLPRVVGWLLRKRSVRPAGWQYGGLKKSR